eukprot:SAG31_NODE_7697_length_1614_cov_1.347855_3_plen_145_part_00
MSAILKPAITLSEEGFPVHKLCSQSWRRSATLLSTQPGGTQMLVPADSEPRQSDFAANGWRGPREGEIWYNKNIGSTFREIAAHGKDGFYRGRVARAIVDVLGRMGGVMTEADLGASCPNPMVLFDQPACCLIDLACSQPHHHV